MRRRLFIALLLALLFVPAGAAAAGQPPPAATDEYVPVDPSADEEQLPAAPLVIGAYAVVWLAVALYLYSIWRRLAHVERELAEVRSRVARGGGGT